MFINHRNTALDTLGRVEAQKKRGFFLSVLLCFCGLIFSLLASSASADVGVAFTGPGGTKTQTLPGSGGQFDMTVPLSKNAINKFTVTASDEFGNTASRDVAVTQVSFDSLVVAKVTAEPLSVERIEQLVNEGVIDIKDPANFNVSQFTIVLTIAQEPIRINVPVVVPKEEPTGYEVYQIPQGDGNGGRPKNQPPVVVLVVEVFPPGVPGLPQPPPIPGIIVIDGRIKTLKEFYSVKFLVMNTSGIFTLKEVNANLEFPNGGLTHILPADGMGLLGDILPGDGDSPGQAQKEFIIRGDEIGTRPIRVTFGGKVGGAGIAEGDEVPFNGAAETTVEVKGPPSFNVRVTHPDAVVADVPYDLGIDITNTGQTPALYASLDLDVGFDAALIKCSLDTNGEPVCEELEGPETRTFGHILPGQTVREVFKVKPKKTGAISSCMGISDQNIELQVTAGAGGCITGKFPPGRNNPDGIPTVAVLPPNNVQGVAIDAPVLLIFDEEMNESTIFTGPGGTVNVFDRAGVLQPGSMRFDTLNGDTFAVWQFEDGVTNRWTPNTEYTIEIKQSIRDKQGNQLVSEYTGRFTTTGEGINDTTAPTLTLGVEPPVNPNTVLPGQIVKVSAYPSDQGSGIQRVELRIKDLDVTDSQYQLIDQRKFVIGDTFPYFFTIDSKKLTPGHTYQLKGTAYDGVGNPVDATLALVVATVAPLPTITLPAADPAGTLRGKSIPVTPLEITGGTYEVRYFLDGAPTPDQTITVTPYQVVVQTKNLSIGNHVLRAVAIDGLGQTGEAFMQFEVLENNFAPTVVFTSPTENQDVVTGTSLSVQTSIEDVTGVESIKWYFNDPNGAPFAQNVKTFGLNTGGIPLGTYKLYVVATNAIGLSTSTADPTTFRTINIINPPPEPAPPPPSFTNITPPVAGKTSFIGTTAPNRRVDISNPAFPGLVLTLQSNGSGNFSGQVDADIGNTINAKAFNAAQTLSSANSATIVPAPASLVSISAAPSSMNFTSFNSFQDITITAQMSDGSSPNVTGGSTFSSSNPAVASVNAAGRVVSLKNGNATITATNSGQTDTVAVTVDVFALESISVTPTPIGFTGVNQTAQLSVTGTYTDATTQPLPTGTVFTTGDPTIATVNSSGLVTAKGPGSTTVTASRSGVPPVGVPVSVTIDDTVDPTAAITSPANGTDVQRGQAVNIAVQAADIGGSGVTKLHLEVTGQASVTDLKQFSATASTNQNFNFVVPNTATIGGTIVVTVTSEDAIGNTSTAAQISLDVVDVTAPSVSITAPAQQTGYNFGDVVNIAVEATDSVGVSQIRYTAEGGVSFDGLQNFSPTPGQRSANFQFTVPFGVVNPDVRIRAYAKDASGNEQQAAPIDILITDADITPPETIATAVTPPGGGTATTVSFQVTSGMDDLDHVELFFRRNGIGTFNRYTDAAGGNPEGKFSPTSGNTGTIVFDSTRMGGDGSYEFYTVGVDTAHNREAAPVSGPDVVPDQSTTFSSGTALTVINTNTAISAADLSFDNQNLRITGAITVTVDGPHTFRNVELLNGAKLVHSAATISTEPGLAITLWTLSVDATSSINVTGLGYRGGLNSGNSSCTGLTLGNAPGATYRSGGSYGGQGGQYQSGVTNPIYGSLADPVELGSGGSCGGSSNVTGGNGGGRINITGINVANDGLFAADGQNGFGFQAGNGSGGAIKISAATVSGKGTIRADGRSLTGGFNEVSGSGGRIAVLFTDISTLDRTKVQALGGVGSNAVGGNGTVFFSGLGETNGTLIVDGQGAGTPFSPISIPPGFTFDNITVRNNARVIIDSPLSITGTFSVQNNSIVTHSVASEAGLVINANKVVVDSTSLIDVTGKGYRGGLNSGNGSCSGLTIGGVTGAVYRSGGSHGGRGGRYDGANVPRPYGDIKNPILLGSGGSCGGSSNVTGGNGGGLVIINATESVQVDGAIRADGQNGFGFQAGNGSGGSVKLTTSNLKGSGVISANGNATSGGFNEVGGGGGRIGIFYDFLGVSGNDLNGTRNITAFGAKGGNAHGSAGSVYFKRSDQSDGDLYLDEALNPGVGAGVVTPLGTHIGFGKIQALTADTFTTDGLVPTLPGGLVGLKIQPNIAVNQEYTIVSNTENTITVSLTGKPALTSIASVGSTYAGVHRFDNVNFRRGTFAMLGDKLIVNDTLLVTENGFLSHYDATTVFASHLDVQAGIVQIDAASRIDASGRGYLAGLSGDNGSCIGMTIPSLSGSTYRSGGSYGGRGGVYTSGASNELYGSVTDPVDLGSGGSCGGSSNTTGGDGGGSIQIVAGDLIVNGELAASGSRTPQGFQAGNGSGGSINLTVGTLSGSGSIRANGETALFGGFNEVGGGGGRIAVRYNVLTLPQSNIQTVGGIGNNATAGQGTIFLKGPGQSLGELVIDGASLNTPEDRMSLPSGLNFNLITFRNNARVTLTEPIVSTGAVQVLNGSRLTHPVGYEDGISISAESLFVDETSSIDASGRGYRGGLNSGNSSCTAETLGGQSGAVYRSGGSYGGVGGVFSGAGSNQVYGIPSEPIYLGSGGSCGGSSNTTGGNGGGRIQINTTNGVVVNGVIRADGQNTPQGFQAGNGSGGSIWIDATNISGAGQITANGFSTVGGFNEVGGGGGRIALYYDSFGGAAGNFNNTESIVATGGHGGNRSGSAGTVYLRISGELFGDLIIDEGLTSGTSSIASKLTPIGFGTVVDFGESTIDLDGTRPVLPGGLVGMKINPNLNNDQTYTIVSNTDTQVTVDTENSDLVDATDIGENYAGFYRFNSVLIRRGAILEMDDLLQVEGQLIAAARSVLTHRAADLSSTSRLDISAGILQVDSTGMIDVSGRGYLGGLQSGNGCRGRTLGNVVGANFRSGGSYGGLGASYLGSVPSPVYGSASFPDELGSGGGCGGSSNTIGGNGGGLFKGTFGSVNLLGVITADGQNNLQSFQAGTGSGGGINLTIGTFSGNGPIRANGFSPSSGNNEVGGGGGRVRIDAVTNTHTGPITAAAGIGGNASGQPGTVVIE